MKITNPTLAIFGSPNTTRKRKIFLWLLRSKRISLYFWLSLLTVFLPPLPFPYGDAVDVIALAIAALALLQSLLRLAQFYRNRGAA